MKKTIIILSLLLNLTTYAQENISKFSSVLNKFLVHKNPCPRVFPCRFCCSFGNLPSLSLSEQIKLPILIRWFTRNKRVIRPFPQVNLHEDIQPDEVHQIGQIPSVFRPLLNVFKEQ